MYARLAPDRQPRKWMLRARLATGVIVNLALPQPFGSFAPPYHRRLIGAIDSNGDHRAEVFASLHGGASVVSIAIFVIHRGRLRQVDFLGGDSPDENLVAVNGGVRHGNGAECLDDGDGRFEIRLLAADSFRFSDGRRYDAEEVTFRWTGGATLQQTGVRRRRGVPAPQSGSEPYIPGRYYRIRCGGFVTQGEPA